MGEIYLSYIAPPQSARVTSEYSLDSKPAKAGSQATSQPRSLPISTAVPYQYSSIRQHSIIISYSIRSFQYSLVVTRYEVLFLVCAECRVGAPICRGRGRKYLCSVLLQGPVLYTKYCSYICIYCTGNRCPQENESSPFPTCFFSRALILNLCLEACSKF